MRTWLGIAVLALIALAGLPRAVAAEEGCFRGLRDCFYRASRYEHWSDRWLAGLDCELNFVSCVRQRVGGW